MGRGPKPTKGKAKPADARVRKLENRLAEAQEQQKATSEILRVISIAGQDLQLVFDTIAQNARRLCESTNAVVSRVEGDLVHLAALDQVIPEGMELARRMFPMSPSRATIHGRVVLDRRVVHIPDVRADGEYSASLTRAIHNRSTLGVPMLLDGRVIGVIAVARNAVRPFADSQIALLQTFADQAVIAIENVRLFNETKEALDQQTATAEILRVISSSPTDIQPVLDAVVESAARLCESVDCNLFRLHGDRLVLAARHGPPGGETVGAFSLPIVRGTVGGRTVLERSAVHVADLLAEADEYPQAQDNARRYGFRTMLSVPLIRNGAAMGVIQVRRTDVRRFTDRQVALLNTFTEQAVIAIENVRLFKELEEKNRALTAANSQVTESLDQQTATAEILRVISSSPTDLQPVFDAILDGVMRLFHPWSANVCQFDGELIHLVATHGGPSEAGRSIRDRFPTRPMAGLTIGRCILDRAVIEIHDVKTAAGLSAATREMAGVRGWRSALAVPMLRDGEPVGAISISRAEAGAFPAGQVELLQTFAAQAVIAIENARLFNELQDKNKALTEAHAQVTESLDQQTATSEILRVISQSPTDVQPVFDTIVGRARHLLNGFSAIVTRLVANELQLAAFTRTTEAADTLMTRAFPMPLGHGSLPAEVVRGGAPSFASDIETDDRFAGGRREVARARGYRSIVHVPMLVEGRAIGTIAVTRRETGPFLPGEIALLQTFADQAVIAIENVRLFTETKEALERQTATSEILRVISQSPTDVQPVFDTIVSSAAVLCHASDVIILVADGDSLRFGASVGPVAASVGQSPLIQDRGLPLTRGSVSGRAVIDRRTVHIHDVSATLDDEFPEGKRLQRQYGGRGTTLAVPLLRDDVSLGVITLVRNEIRPFTDQQVALLETFADQAVIAIENVRLFTELQEKNRALTEAHAQVTESLDQQTATSEILSVISGSPTNIQPVFDTVAKSAARLCEASDTSIFRLDGDRLLRVAHHGSIPAGVIGEFAVPLVRGSFAGRCVLDGRIVHIADGQTEANEFPEGSEAARRLGFRAILLVPLLREGVAIGVITLRRTEPRLFTEQQVTVLKTFADQAVIAIENVRLFTELQARTQDLTRSVGQLTALGEVGRAVSSTLDLETVLNTIVSRAIQLSGTDGGSVYEYDEATEEFSLRASRDLPEAYVEQVRDTRPRKGEGAVGRVAQTREPVQIADISDPAAYESRVRGTLLHIGLRALLAVPLMAEDQLVGALIVMRKRTGTFAAEEVTLLQTFATQSALAIQNARLFREIEDKSRQLEVASQHKSEFLANMSHELRTPLNAIIGFSEVLSEKMFGELNEKQEEYSKDIHASGQHLLSLINDILDLSKIEAGRMELELSDFHLPTALDSALTLVRERAGRRGVALHLSVDERLGQIQADERKVRQVVLNLLSNAIKFTPEGGRIEVMAAPKDGVVEVSVSDTGVGIASEDQDAVFEEFRQVGTADKKVEGTGLGLTLCRKFVELHGGRIWVKSELGKGSTFTFTIPVRHGE